MVLAPLGRGAPKCRLEAVALVVPSLLLYRYATFVFVESLVVSSDTMFLDALLASPVMRRTRELCKRCHFHWLSYTLLQSTARSYHQRYTIVIQELISHTSHAPTLSAQ